MGTKTPFSEVKGMGEPARRALASVGYTYVEDLIKTTEKDLKKLHGMGPKALRILREVLQSRGMDFKKE